MPLITAHWIVIGDFIRLEEIEFDKLRHALSYQPHAPFHYVMRRGKWEMNGRRYLSQEGS